MHGYFLLLLTCWLRTPPPHQVVPYPDNSLDTEQYRSLGIPATDAPWTASDYQIAFQILDQLYAEDKTALPRADSPYSGMLFARMTDLDNFRVANNPGRQLIRLEHARALIERLRLYYVEPTHAHERFGRETLRLLVLDFRIQSEIRRTIQTLRPQYPAENHPRAPQTRPQPNTKVLQTLLQTLEQDAQRYDETAMSDFLNQLYFVFPEYLDAVQREEVHQRLIFVEARFPYADGRPLIAELRGVL